MLPEKMTDCILRYTCKKTAVKFLGMGYNLIKDRQAVTEEIVT